MKNATNAGLFTAPLIRRVTNFTENVWFLNLASENVTSCGTRPGAPASNSSRLRSSSRVRQDQCRASVFFLVYGTLSGLEDIGKSRQRSTGKQSVHVVFKVRTCAWPHGLDVALPLDVRASSPSREQHKVLRSGRQHDAGSTDQQSASNVFLK